MTSPAANETTRARRGLARGRWTSVLATAAGNGRRCPDSRGRTIRKHHLKDGTCKVSFELAAQAGVEAAHLFGEFNDWSATATPMTRRWENDWAADDYVPNELGGDESLVAA